MCGAGAPCAVVGVSIVIRGPALRSTSVIPAGTVITASTGTIAVIIAISRAIRAEGGIQLSARVLFDCEIPQCELERNFSFGEWKVC